MGVHSILFKLDNSSAAPALSPSLNFLYPSHNNFCFSPSFLLKCLIKANKRKRPALSLYWYEDGNNQTVLFAVARAMYQHGALLMQIFYQKGLVCTGGIGCCFVFPLSRIMIFKKPSHLLPRIAVQKCNYFKS